MGGGGHSLYAVILDHQHERGLYYRFSPFLSPIKVLKKKNPS